MSEIWFVLLTTSVAAVKTKAERAPAYVSQNGRHHLLNIRQKPNSPGAVNDTLTLSLVTVSNSYR